MLEAAKHSPIDVWPQLFASDCAVCDALDVRAVIGGYLVSHSPITDLLRGSAKRSRQRVKSAQEFDCFIDGVHASHTTPCV